MSLKDFSLILLLVLLFLLLWVVSEHTSLSVIFWGPENAYYGRGKDVDSGERKRFSLRRDVSRTVGHGGSSLGLQFLLGSSEGQEMSVGS